MQLFELERLVFDLADFIVTMPKPTYTGMGANIGYEKFNRVRSQARNYLRIHHPEHYKMLLDLGMII